MDDLVGYFVVGIVLVALFFLSLEHSFFAYCLGGLVGWLVRDKTGG